MVNQTSSETREPGLLIRPVSDSIEINWRGASFAIAEFIIQAALLPFTAGGSTSSMVSSAKDFLDSISAKESIERRGHVLLALSLALSIDALVPSRPTELRKNTGYNYAKTLNAAIHAEVGRSVHVLTSSFFENPSSFSLYTAIRPTLVLCLSRARNTHASFDVHLGAQLDSAFNTSVYRILSLRPDYFEDVLLFLQTPGLIAAKHEWEWQGYRRALISQFDVQPVFGQEESKVSLGQLYVSLDAEWQSTKDESTTSRRERSGEAAFQYLDTDKARGSLEETMLRWVDNPVSNDGIRLIFGGPGSGKSSFMKSFAASMARRYDVIPILVELQRLTRTKDLAADIERLFVREYRHFSSSPLSLQGPNRRYLILFDGLDELVVPHSTAADRVASEFASTLVALMKELYSSSECRVQVVVTGRTHIIKSFATMFDLPAHAVLHVQSYTSSDTDLRPQWWLQYSNATGQSTELPQAFDDPELREITSEPLLCYLFALSGYATREWEMAASNHNLIYSQLLEEVWRRRWGDSSLGPYRAGPGLALQLDEFLRLMETMALAAWWGGEIRVATMERFKQALKVTGAQDAWEKFSRDIQSEGRGALSTLALTFYFRPSEVEGQGVEFTHKSFSEYLVGRFVVRHAYRHVAKELENPRFSVKDGATWWCSFAIFGLVTEEIIRFMTYEAKLMSDEYLSCCRRNLQRILNFVISDELPIHLNPFDGSYRSLAKRQLLGTLTLLACLGAIINAQRSRRHGAEAIEVDWGDEPWRRATFIRSLVNSTPYGAMPPISIANIDFSANEIGSSEEEFCASLFLAGVDLSGCNLSGLDLSSSNFNQASLADAVCKATNFATSQFVGTDFSGADLERADFSGAIFGTISMASAPNFSRCNISGTMLPWNWLDIVSQETFVDPPRGKPTFLSRQGTLDGALEPGKKGYPNLTYQYEKRAKGPSGRLGSEN